MYSYARKKQKTVLSGAEYCKKNAKTFAESQNIYYLCMQNIIYKSAFHAMRISIYALEAAFLQEFKYLCNIFKRTQQDIRIQAMLPTSHGILFCQQQTV